ncbi:TetR/AcrR family transcriptional regulator [Syntrophomonas palmitatica]|uniref:TetR/AcrR family transcriptional regulator n=1 Tax=Syntrophomonas palmitatica TaxID=402877 RepID=UPI0006D0B017|nr:TetR/AcrR family transcriptional regulator [Syntrophomonas palmitatica]
MLRTNSYKVCSGSRTERKKEETKQKIINTALGLFKDQGVDATSMEQIAREADIARGTLYNYFPVKEAIIDEIIKRSFQTNHQERIQQIRSLPDTRSRMIYILDLLTMGIYENQEIFEKYMVYRMQSMISFHEDTSDQSGFYLLGNEIIAVGQKNGELRDDLPTYVLRELFEFAFIEIVKELYFAPERFNRYEVIERYVDLCLRGIKRENMRGDENA